jgi:hypothetical protein
VPFPDQVDRLGDRAWINWARAVVQQDPASKRSNPIGTPLAAIADSWRRRAPASSRFGDVRSGSIKRVAAAVGEGAQVMAALHRYLTDDQDAAVAISHQFGG